MTERRASLILGGVTVAVLGVGLIVGRSDAGAYRPVRPDEVVARVPARASDPVARKVAELEAAISADSSNVAAATALARLGIETARRRSDPRYLGKAEAALARWWKESGPPDDVLVLRATIRQARHEFEAALVDLDRLVARTPDNAQAQLTRATVLTVLGRFHDALAACDALAPRAGWFWATACRAPAMARTGRSREATAALAAALPVARTGERAWGESLLGEILYWSGDPAAEGHLRAALAVDPDDVYTRAVLADLLLDGGRAREAEILLAGREQHDALLLRLALADAQLGRRGPAAEALRARFAAVARRGGSLHQREEARFALAVERDPGRALALALRGFEGQKEPWDVRLALEAALSARDAKAAAPVVAWMHRGGEESPRLLALAEALR